MHFFTNFFCSLLFLLFPYGCFLFACLLNQNKPARLWRRKSVLYAQLQKKQAVLLLLFFSEQKVSFEKKKTTSFGESVFCLKSQTNCQKSLKSVI